MRGEQGLGAARTGSVPGGGAGPGPWQPWLWGCPGVWRRPGETRGAAELTSWWTVPPREGALGQQGDREVVASGRSDGCSPWPAGPEGLHQEPWCSSGTGEGAGSSLSTPDRRHGPVLPASPLPSSGQKWAPAKRQTVGAKCPDHPAPALSSGPVFLWRPYRPEMLAGLGASVSPGEQSRACGAVGLTGGPGAGTAPGSGCAAPARPGAHCRGAKGSWGARAPARLGARTAQGPHPGAVGAEALQRSGQLALEDPMRPRLGSPCPLSLRGVAPPGWAWVPVGKAERWPLQLRLLGRGSAPSTLSGWAPGLRAGRASSPGFSHCPPTGVQGGGAGLRGSWEGRALGWRPEA